MAQDHVDPYTNNNQQTNVPPVYYVQQPNGPIYPPSYNGQPMYVSGHGQPTPTPTYYVPQPNYYYVTPPPTTPFMTQIPQNAGVPLIDANLTVKERLLSREYEVQIGQWFSEAWDLFKLHWISFVLFSILFIGLSFIPYVSFLLLGLAPGFLIAGSNAVRPGGRYQWNDLFHGILLFFPLLLQTILYSLLVSFGLLLFILPGLYFLIAYSFSSIIYIEFREEGLGLLDAMTVSRKLVSKNFWGILGFLIVQLLVVALGCVFLVGVFVALPVASLSTVFALRDMCGFSSVRDREKSCVCC